MEQFAAVQPVLPSKNVTAAILFYQRLGFELRFQDALENPNYAGVGRDQVEIHIQSHAPEEWDRVERPMLRFKINDVEALFQDGNTVIDHERITGIPGSETFDAVAIYKIEDGKIAKVYFVRQ